MRKLLLGLMFFIFSISANATNLLEVYQQAVMNDAIFQQALAQRLADKQAVPINIANILPNIGVTATPNIYKTAGSGPANFTGTYSQRGYYVNAVVTQTIFNFAQFTQIASANAFSKQADAILNAAAQSLILRVSNAYFAVLEDEDNLRYALSNKKAYAKQLDQVSQQYKVGLKTITDVYTARASYESSTANVIAVETKLENDKENLRVITGNFYPNLAKLSEKFPLVSPQPANRETWVNTAQQQNWDIKASQLALEIAMQNIKLQQSGHLPTLNAQGTYNITFTRNTGGTGAGSDPAVLGGQNLFAPAGANQTHNRTVQLNFAFPVFSGGQVVAQTKQAQYQYQVSSQRLTQTVRETINITRQSYLGVIASISQVKADRQAVISTRSSVEGMEAGYRVGTVTLVDVLNQQLKYFFAQQEYSADRYAYIKNLLTLKKAAGTLSPDDIQAINSWLLDTSDYAEEKVRSPRGIYKN